MQASGADDTFAPWTFSNPWFGTLRARAGIAAGGAGAEVAVIANWSAKVVSLYVNLDSSPYILSGTSHGIASNVLRIGVNYRF